MAEGATSVQAELKRWPKVELHRHLEGTVRLATAWQWAQHSPTLSFSTIDELRSAIQFDGICDFAHFLSKFRTLRELYYDPRAIEQVIREAVADAAADNIRYLELRFSPDHFARQAGHDPHETAASILRHGMDEASKQGIVVRFLCTIGRGYDLATAEDIFNIAHTLKEEGIVGIDLAGDELLHPAPPFRAMLERAAAEGLGLSIHAGEAGPVENVWEAVMELGAHRIGHGIRSVEEPALMEMLHERDIALEVCPTSNLHTGAIASPKEHPLATLVRAGVPVALSSDDPAISDICLTDEYCFALEQAELTRAELRRMVLTAAHHAFLPPTQKAALLETLDQELLTLVNLPSDTE